MAKRVWLIVYKNAAQDDDVQVVTCHSKGSLVAELDRVKKGYYIGNTPVEVRIFELDPVEMVLTEVKEPTVTISPV